LKHQLAHWRSRVDGLLVEVKINAGGLKLLDRVEQVNERTSGTSFTTKPAPTDAQP
jgi:hypothetical protein